MNAFRSILLMLFLFAIQVRPNGYMRAPELFGTAAYYQIGELIIIQNSWVVFIADEGNMLQIGGQEIRDRSTPTGEEMRAEAIPYSLSENGSGHIFFRGHERKLCAAQIVERLKCK